MASACAYCALLSLIPLLVVGIAAFGFVLGGSAATAARVVRILQAFAPGNMDYSTTVRAVLDHVLRDRHMLGYVGILGLLWAANQVFLSLQQAMNVIHGVQEHRNWARQRLVAVATVAGTLLMLAANIFVVASFARLEKLLGTDGSAVVHLVLNRTLAAVVPTLMLWYLFALLYRALPACVVPYRSALLGAGVAAAAWQVSLIGFGTYLRYQNGYDRLYGPLAALAILVVWFYYCMAILLLGAEITADDAGKLKNREHVPDPPTSDGSSSIYMNSDSVSVRGEA